MIPHPAIDVWVERIVDQIVYSFSDEQMMAWDSGTMFVSPPRIAIEPWFPSNDEKALYFPPVDPRRGSGRTYYIACLYIIWCIRNPNVWIHLREPQYLPPSRHSDTSLVLQVRALEETYLASTPFALEIKNGNMIRGVPRK